MQNTLLHVRKSPAVRLKIALLHSGLNLPPPAGALTDSVFG